MAVMSEPLTHGHSPYDRLHELVTTSEAASLAGVAVNTITTWRNRGILTPAGSDTNGRPLYRFLDVAKAERATRDRARRHR